MPEELSWVDRNGQKHRWACTTHRLCYARYIWAYETCSPFPRFWYILFESDIMPYWPTFVRDTLKLPGKLPFQALLDFREHERYLLTECISSNKEI